jgi:hypothetical protein
MDSRPVPEVIGMMAWNPFDPEEIMMIVGGAQVMSY